MRILTATIIILMLFSSCEKMILGEDEKNTPDNNFEILWNDFDQHYGLFVARGINWDSLYSVYRPQVNSQTTEQELWDIFSHLIEHLDDSHTGIINLETKEKYVSGYALNEQSTEEFSESLITDKYLEYRTIIETETKLSYGKIKDKNIGYIYLGAEDGQSPEKIDEIIQNLKNMNAIILDVRQNEGGFDTYAARIAGAFADSEKFIFSVQTRNGANHDDFDEKKLYYTKKQGDEQFLKPVIVLTDRYTISAGEILLLHLKSFNHVTQVGDTTAGDFSDVSGMRFLPNGWVYRYSIMMYLMPDGSSLDGIGHVPDVYIKNEKSDIDNQTDKVIEKAIDYLFETHGIE